MTGVPFKVFYGSQQQYYRINGSMNIRTGSISLLVSATIPLNPHRTYLELGHFGYRIKSRVSQLIGRAFRKVESHEDYPDRVIISFLFDFYYTVVHYVQLRLQ